MPGEPLPQNPLRVSPITKDEFCSRFKEHMLRRVGPIDASGGLVAPYANETAPTYFDDEMFRGMTPEECADTDLSYWEPE